MVDAEEIVQESFLVVSKKSHAWVEGTNFYAWACSVVRYQTLSFQRDRGRARRRLTSDVVGLLEACVVQDKDFPAVQSQISALGVCLSRLSSRAFELINLRYHCAKMPSQIASENGWSVNAVRVGLSRARHSLRECLERAEGADG